MLQLIHFSGQMDKCHDICIKTLRIQKGSYKYYKQ